MVDLKPKLDSRWTSWYQETERRVVAEVAVFVVGMKGFKIGHMQEAQGL